MNQKPELKCHIVPTEHGNILMPDDLLVDVLKVDVLPVNNQLTWRGRQVPLFIASAVDEVNLFDRVAIIKTIVADQALPFFAVKVSGIPYSIYVGEEMMSNAKGEQKPAIGACLARVGNLLCVVPDLPKIERYMWESLR